MQPRDDEQLSSAGPFDRAHGRKPPPPRKKKKKGLDIGCVGVNVDVCGLP